MKTEEKLNEFLLKQINEILEEYNDKKGPKSSIPKGGSNDILIHNLITRIFATLERIVGRKSEYYKHALSIASGQWIDSKVLDFLIGTLEGLYHDLKNNYLKSLTEIIHGNVFGDYLEMAEHLQKEGYKVPAAVIAGSTLEQHLRKLSQKAVIDVKLTSGKPKKADLLNSDLAKQGIYNKSEQKQITAWLGIRNDAAHGNVNAYTTDQVNLFIVGLRDFIIRHPA